MSVAKLEDFKKRKEEHVLECKCGCQLWFLIHDGSLQCRSCLQIHQRIMWNYRQGEEP
jgi:hypothetical protein